MTRFLQKVIGFLAMSVVLFGFHHDLFANPCARKKMEPGHPELDFRVQLQCSNGKFRIILRLK